MAKVKTKHLLNEKCNALSVRITRLQVQLEEAYKQRAGCTYGGHGWGFCLCGRESKPGVDEQEAYCAHCDPQKGQF